MGRHLQNNIIMYHQLAEKALHAITFAKIDSPSSPLFKSLQIIKFSDIIYLEIALFMFDFHNKKIVPTIFSDFFAPVSNIHFYITRLTSKCVRLTLFHPFRNKNNISKFSPDLQNNQISS